VSHLVVKHGVRQEDLFINMQSEKPITLSEILRFIPIALLFVTMVASWMSLTYQNADNKQVGKANQDEIKDIKLEQKRMSDEIIRLGVIIDRADKAGKLGYIAPGTQIIAKTEPTIIPTQAPSRELAYTFNLDQSETSDNSAEMERNPSPVPTPTPENTDSSVPQIVQPIVDFIEDILP
jgi:hypothetical protein